MHAESADISRRPEHVPYDQTRQPYHDAIGRLAAQYAPNDGAVVDIGCGLGHVLEVVRQKRADVELIGIDDDRRCIDITRDRLGVGLRTMQVDLGAPDVGSSLPEADVAVLSHVMEHLLEPHVVLRAVLERLRSGGVAVLAVPNPVRPQVFVANLRRRRYSNEGHVYSWDRSHWENYLERVLDLDVLEYASDYVPLFPEAVRRRLPFLRRFEIYLARRFPWFGFSHIAVVRARR